MDLKSRLPYTEAAVSEIQRLASVLPIAPPRLATKDINLHGYNIPKGTQVQCNLVSML
jgi:cytochrome P450